MVVCGRSVLKARRVVNILLCIPVPPNGAAPHAGYSFCHWSLKARVEESSPASAAKELSTLPQAAMGRASDIDLRKMSEHPSRTRLLSMAQVMQQQVNREQVFTALLLRSHRTHVLSEESQRAAMQAIRP